MWLHYPEDPAGSSWHFRYNGDGAEESLSQEQVATRVAGRARPIIDFGQAIAEQVAVTISCDGDTRDLAVLKAFVRAQWVVCYRDGQGRKYVGTLALSKLTDQFWGAEVDITINTVDDVRNDLPVAATTAAEAGNA